MVLIILCVGLLVLLLLAIGVTMLICLLAGETFSWGIVALVWLILLIVTVTVGGGDGWE